MPITRDVHPYLRDLHRQGVIVPVFEPLTDEQIENPLYTDYLDYSQSEWCALSQIERTRIEENSPSCWIHKYLKIKDKNQKIIPFVWNEEQWIMFLVVREFWKRGMPVRIIVLKDRQIGSTTFWTSLFTERMNKIPNTGALMLAHDKGTSEQIFRMFDTYQKHNPIRFDTEYKSKGAMKLAGIGSEIRTGTAYNTSEGVGTTINILLGEEVARWRDGGELVAAMFQAIPMVPNSMIILNSTAKGAGNYFHNTWKRSKSPDSVFKGIFLPWYIHKEYSLPFGSKTARIDFAKTLTEDEIEQKEKFGLTLEQLNWRRAKIAEQAGDNDPVAKFRENYPSTDTEAFLSASSSFFDNMLLDKRQTELIVKNRKSAPVRGVIAINGPNAKFRADRTGWLEMYCAPQKGRKYVVSIDTSMGGDGGDPSSIDVMDVKSFTQVAHSNAVIQGESQADRAMAVAKLYNNAMVVPEKNYNPMVTDLLVEKYGRVYKRKSSSRTYGDRWGWRTDEQTKLQMLERLRWAINNGILEINCIETIEEMMAFGYDGKKIQGQRGSKDDRVISLAMATEVSYNMFTIDDVDRVQKIKVGGRVV